MLPKKIKLRRGGILLAVETDKFKSEMLTLSLPFPMEQRKNRLCRLLFNILKRGCVSYPDLSSLSRRLDDLYDANIEMMTSSTGENTAAGFVVECLDSAYVGCGEDLLSGAMDTLGKMLYEPLLSENGAFNEKVLEIEKRNICDGIRASENDSRIRSYRLCRQLMFEGEPYGRPSLGSIEEIMSVTGRELADFRYEYLSMSAPLFVYVGRRGSNEIEELIYKHFPDFGGSDMTLGDTVYKSAPSKMRSIEEDMAVVQGKLTMGFRADMSPCDDDFYAALLFNDIFGGSASSKLFRNVREAQSLCYYCGTSFDGTKGVIFMRSGIANENKERVMDEVLHQFDEIRRGNISEYEFDCSVKSSLNSYRQAEDSLYSIENFYRNRFISGAEHTFLEAAEKISSVRAEDIVRAANRYAPDSTAFVRGTAESSSAFEEYDDE